jgi:hypothetical protein
MITIEDVIEQLTEEIARDFLRADKLGLRRTQTAAGVLMAIAQAKGDKDTAYRFRVLAAQAANKQEELDQD